jgi:hypothetical protein
MNRNLFSRFLLGSAAVSALLSILVLTPGCLIVAAGAAGAGTVAWVEGKLEVNLDSPYDDVGRAADRAIADLQLAKVSEAKDAFSDHFVARTAGDKKVEIVVAKVGDHLTKVDIRVGTFGDKAVSMSILDKIKANL